MTANHLPAPILTKLDRALEAAPGPVRFWLRDDDAVAFTPPLERLLTLAERLSLPVAIAVIPAHLEQSAVSALRAHPEVHVLQHGFDHENHAPAGEKKRELGGNLAVDQVLERLRHGRERLFSHMRENHLPVLVPPWNRIDDAVVMRLGELGYQGLSTFAEDRRGESAGLIHANPQIDPVSWRTDRSFLDAPALAEAIIERLAIDATTPIGLLTHHLIMGEADFATIETVLAAIGRHEKSEWLSPKALFEIKM